MRAHVVKGYFVNKWKRVTRDGKKYLMFIENLTRLRPTILNTDLNLDFKYQTRHYVSEYGPSDGESDDKASQEANLAREVVQLPRINQNL